MTKVSPEKIISILASRPAANLLVAKTVGVIRPGINAKKLEAHFAKAAQGKHGPENYFTVGLSQRTWHSNEAVAIQITGMCPLANRQAEDADALFAAQARLEEVAQSIKVESNSSMAVVDDKEIDFLDMASKQRSREEVLSLLKLDGVAYTVPVDLEAMQANLREVKARKYQVTVEIRSSSEILGKLFREEFESVLADLSVG